jgi:hypothetical protein
LGNKKQKKIIKKLIKLGIITSDDVKTSCCKKYKKAKEKRCAKCPCYDLFKKNHVLKELILAKKNTAV